MRPIDADALIEKCGGWYVDECTESGFIGTLENLLATEPTIQPQSTTGQLNDGARSTAQSTDLIDRQAAIDALENSSKPYVWQGAEIVRNLPSAQPEPKEGHWIRRGCGIDIECKCSVCGYKDFVEPYDIYWFKRNYCPNCGAHMKGERQK